MRSDWIPRFFRCLRHARGVHGAERGQRACCCKIPGASRRTQCVQGLLLLAVARQRQAAGVCRHGAQTHLVQARKRLGEQVAGNLDVLFPGRLLRRLTILHTGWVC